MDQKRLGQTQPKKALGMGLAVELAAILHGKDRVSPHLDLVVRLFVRKDKRDRIVSLASSAKRRADLRDALLVLSPNARAGRVLREPRRRTIPARV